MFENIYSGKAAAVLLCDSCGCINEDIVSWIKSSEVGENRKRPEGAQMFRYLA